MNSKSNLRIHKDLEYAFDIVPIMERVFTSTIPINDYPKFCGQLDDFLTLAGLYRNIKEKEYNTETRKVFF